MIDPERINDIARSAADSFGVPSLSVSVIQDGEQTDVCIGCRSDTVFPVGELSKTFLSAAVRSSGIDPDLPVRQISGWFRLKDTETTDKVTIRDILLQRTGVPEHMLSWFIQPQLTSEEVTGIAGYLDAAAGLGERPIRQDHMFAALSRAVEDLTGSSWYDLVKTEVLDSIETRSTYSSWSHLSGSGCPGAADLFYSSRGSLVKGTRWMTDQLAGGGSMYCCTSDLARLAERNRTGGGIEKIPAEERDFFDFPLQLIGAADAGEGDGWVSMDLLGSRIVCGTGTSGGSRVFAGWMEDIPLSFAAAVNLDGSRCAEAVGLSLCELASRGEVSDWNAVLRRISDSVYDSRRRANSALLRACTDDVFASRVTGIYKDPGYGELYFYEEYGRLFLELFDIPMRIYRTEGDICVLDATQVLGKAVPCTVSDDRIGLLLEPKTRRMVEFIREN